MEVVGGHHFQLPAIIRCKGFRYEVNAHVSAYTGFKLSCQVIEVDNIYAQFVQLRYVKTTLCQCYSHKILLFSIRPWLFLEDVGFFLSLLKSVFLVVSTPIGANSLTTYQFIKQIM